MSTILFKRLCLLSFVLFASACGSASFSGKGKKSHQDGRDQDPASCKATQSCPVTHEECPKLTAVQLALVNLEIAKNALEGAEPKAKRCELPEEENPGQNNPGQNPGQNS